MKRSPGPYIFLCILGGLIASLSVVFKLTMTLSDWVIPVAVVVSLVLVAAGVFLTARYKKANKQ